MLRSFFMGDSMKKQFLGFIFIFTMGTLLFAGDAAAFVDLGISKDGKVYAFGQYGKVDKSFQGYAEIYTVDIEKNDWIDGGVFRTKPSNATLTKSGKSVFDSLYKKAEWSLKKYGLVPSTADNLLYVRQDNSSSEKIIFKDFEGSTFEKNIYYHIDLIKNVEGVGINTKSSFFISLEKKDDNGNIISRNVVGNPDIKRKGVSGYSINRIFSDKSGRSLVFVIEKTVEDSSGTSIRYMVETIRL